MSWLKTGTPPRIKMDSVDLSKMTVQPGDFLNQTFSHENISNDKKQVPCYLTHTSKETHDIIRLNLHESAMYGGVVDGIGPRYCPSIEDKVVKFSDKDRHQIFIEPESMHLDEFYIQGLSTTLPKHIQHELLKTIEGLESAIITKYAYAIEYDAINPIQLKQTLETKKIENLFCAGQINGTSGYEEAAGQGLMAGINAALKVDAKEPFILGRHEAYIGVLIDDLITKGTQEPYRLLTSRAEFRLLLRHDNADMRLTEKGFEIGLVKEDQYQVYKNKKDILNQTLNALKENVITPNDENNRKLVSMSSAPIFESISLEKLLKRPEIHIESLETFGFKVENQDIKVILETIIKYDGYIQKAMREADKMTRLEHKIIPLSVQYKKILNMSSEAREKLDKIKPETIGQASRILGVNPVDISVLIIHIESGNKAYV